MGGGGYEKEAAVPLGVSLCPETGIIDAVTELPSSPSRQIRTTDGRSLDAWLAGPPYGIPVLYHSGTPRNGTILDELIAGPA